MEIKNASTVYFVEKAKCYKTVYHNLGNINTTERNICFQCFPISNTMIPLGDRVVMNY